MVRYMWKNYVGLIDDDTGDPDNYVHIVGSEPVLDALQCLSLDRATLLTMCKHSSQWVGTQNDLISPICEVVVKRADCDMYDNYNIMGWIVQTKFSRDPRSSIRKCSDNPFNNTADFHMFKNAILLDETTPGIVVVDNDCELACHDYFFVQLVLNVEHRLDISNLGVCSVLGNTAIGVYRILKRLPSDSFCICVEYTYPIRIVTKLLSLFKGDMFNGSPTFVRFVVPSAIKSAVNLVSLEMYSAHIPRDIAVFNPVSNAVARRIMPLLRCEMLRCLGSTECDSPVFVAVHMFDAIVFSFPKPDVAVYLTRQDVHFDEELLSYCDIVCRSFSKRFEDKTQTLQFCSVSTYNKVSGRVGMAPNRFVVHFSHDVECVQADLNRRVIHMPKNTETGSCMLSLFATLDYICYLFGAHVFVSVKSRSDKFCRSMIQAFSMDASSKVSYTVCVQCVNVMGLPGMPRGGTYVLPDWSADCVPIDMLYVKDSDFTVSDLMSQELPTEELNDDAGDGEEDMAELIGMLNKVHLMGPSVSVSQTPVAQVVMNETPCKPSQFTDNMYGSLQPHILKAVFIFCDYAIDRNLGVFLAFVPKTHMLFHYYSGWHLDVFGDQDVADSVDGEWTDLVSCDSNIPYTNTVAIIDKCNVLSDVLSTGDFSSSFLIERNTDEAQIGFVTPREKVLSDDQFLAPLQDKNLYHMVLCVTLSPIGLKLVPQTPKLNLYVRQIPEGGCSTTPGLRCLQRPALENSYLKASYDEACYLGWRSTWKSAAESDGGEATELIYTVSDVLKLFYEIVHPNIERLKVGSIVSTYELKPMYCERQHKHEFKTLMAFLSMTTDVIALSQNVYMAYRQTGAASVKLKDFLCPSPKANLVMLLLIMNEPGVAPLISRMFNPMDVADVECPYYTEWIDTVLSAYSRTFGPVYVFDKEDWYADSSVGKLDMYRLTDVMPYNRSKKDLYINHSMNIKRFVFCGISPMLYLKGVGPLVHSPMDNLPIVVDNVHFRTNVELLKENNTDILWPDPDPLLPSEHHQDLETAGNRSKSCIMDGIKDPSSEAFCPRLPPPPSNQAGLTVGFGPEVTPKLFVATTVLSEDERTWEVPVQNLTRTADFAKLGTGPEVPFSGLPHDISVVKRMDCCCTVISRPLGVAFARFTNRIVTNNNESIWTTGLTKVIVRTINEPLYPFYRRRDTGLIVIPSAKAHISMPAVKDHPFGVDTVIHAKDLIPIMLKNILTYAKVYIRCERKGQTITIQKILAAVAVIVGCNSKLVILSTPEGPSPWLRATYGIAPTTQKDVEIIQQGKYVGYKVSFKQAALKDAFVDTMSTVGAKTSVGFNQSINNYTIVFYDTDEECNAARSTVPRTVHHICINNTWLKNPKDIVDRLIAYRLSNDKVVIMSKLTLRDVVPLHLSWNEAEKYIEKYVSGAVACDGAILDSYVQPNVSDESLVSTQVSQCTLAMADNDFLTKRFTDLLGQVNDETEKALLSIDVFAESGYPPKYKQHVIWCRTMYNHNDMVALHVGGLEFEFENDRVGGIVIEDTDSAYGTVIEDDGTVSIRVNVTSQLDLWKTVLVVCDVGGPFVCLNLTGQVGDAKTVYYVNVCKILSCMHVISKRKALPFSKVRILARKALVANFAENMLRHFICYNDTCYVFKQSFDHLNTDLVPAPKTTFTAPKHIYDRMISIRNTVCYELPTMTKRLEFVDANVENGLWITMVVFFISQGLYITSNRTVVDIITLYRTYRHTVSKQVQT